MEIGTSDISAKQRDTVLEMDEGHFCDLKAIEIAPAKLTKHISAFGNASGGELYIGIDETDTGIKEQKGRTWRGFEKPEAANGHIQIFEKLFPLGQFFSYTFLRAPGSIGLLLQVEVRKTREIVVASDGTAYVRRGAQSLPCSSPEEKKRLELDKGVSSFENHTVDAPISIITNSVPVLEFLSNVIPSAEPEPWLTKQILIVDGKPTVGGVLLFAEEPQAALPKRCAIKIYRYKTSEDFGTRETLDFDPLTVEGCLYDQIKAAVGENGRKDSGRSKIGSQGTGIRDVSARNTP